MRASADYEAGIESEEEGFHERGDKSENEHNEVDEEFNQVNMSQERYDRSSPAPVEKKSPVPIKTEVEEHPSKKKRHMFDGEQHGENWMNQNDDVKPEPHKFPERSRMSILNPEDECRPFLPLLQNGHSFSYYGKQIVIRETCGFDSFAQIFMAIYVDSCTQ